MLAEELCGPLECESLEKHLRNADEEHRAIDGHGVFSDEAKRVANPGIAKRVAQAMRAQIDSYSRHPLVTLAVCLVIVLTLVVGGAWCISQQ